MAIFKKAAAALLLINFSVLSWAQASPTDAEIEACVRAGGSLKECTEPTTVESCIRAGDSLAECTEEQPTFGHIDFSRIAVDAVGAAENTDTFPEISHLPKIDALVSPGICDWTQMTHRSPFMGELFTPGRTLKQSPMEIVVVSNSPAFKRTRTSTVSDDTSGGMDSHSVSRSISEQISTMGGMVNLYSDYKSSGPIFDGRTFQYSTTGIVTVTDTLDVDGSLYPLATGKEMTVKTFQTTRIISDYLEESDDTQGRRNKYFYVVIGKAENVPGVPASIADRLWNVRMDYKTTQIQSGGYESTGEYSSDILLREDNGCPYYTKRQDPYSEYTDIGPGGEAHFELVYDAHTELYEKAIADFNAALPDYLAGRTPEVCKSGCRQHFDEYGDCVDESANRCLQKFCGGSRVRCRSDATVDSCDAEALRVCTARKDVCTTSCASNPKGGFALARTVADNNVAFEGDHRRPMNNTDQFLEALGTINQALKIGDPGPSSPTAVQGSTGMSDDQKLATVNQCQAQRCGHLKSGCEQRGAQKDCHLASACYCECALEIDPQNSEAPQFRKCIQEGRQKAGLFQ